MTTSVAPPPNLPATSPPLAPQQAHPSRDWRFPQLRDAQRQGGSTLSTVYGFYRRTHDHVSRELASLVDGLLLIAPSRRLRVQEVHGPLLDCLHPPSRRVRPREDRP